MYKKINTYIQKMDRNNNSDNNVKLQIKSFLKKISLQLYFKESMFIQFLRLDGRNNNSNKNIKLQIKSFLKKISLQLYFKRHKNFI